MENGGVAFAEPTIRLADEGFRHRLVNLARTVALAAASDGLFGRFIRARGGLLGPTRRVPVRSVIRSRLSVPRPGDGLAGPVGLTCLLTGGLPRRRVRRGAPIDIDYQVLGTHHMGVIERLELSRLRALVEGVDIALKGIGRAGAECESLFVVISAAIAVARLAHRIEMIGAHLRGSAIVRPRFRLLSLQFFEHIAKHIDFRAGDSVALGFLELCFKRLKTGRILRHRHRVTEKEGGEKKHDNN